MGIRTGSITPGGGGTAEFDIISVDVSTSIATPDIGVTVLADPAFGSITVTLPNNAAAVGKIFDVVGYDNIVPGQDVTIDVSGGGFINGAASLVISKNRLSYWLQCTAAGQYQILADYDPTAAAPDLQTVTDAGNETTDTIIVNSVHSIAIRNLITAGIYALAVSDETVTIDLADGDYIIELPDDPAAVGKIYNFKVIEWDAVITNTATIKCATGSIDPPFTQYILSIRDEALQLKCIAAGEYIVMAPNNRQSENFYAINTSGATVDIPHRLSELPTSVWVQAANNDAANALVGGYYLTVGITQITINLLVPIAAPVALQFYYGVYKSY